jgi:hypothetical protein
LHLGEDARLQRGSWAIAWRATLILRRPLSSLSSSNVRARISSIWPWRASSAVAWSVGGTPRPQGEDDGVDLVRVRIDPPLPLRGGGAHLLVGAPQAHEVLHLVPPLDRMGRHAVVRPGA